MTFESKKTWKRDFILILILVLILVFVSIFLYFRTSGRQKGMQVYIYEDGKHTKTFLLSEDIEYTINTEGGTNTLIIKDGKAYVREADCPDKICVNHRPISREGEEIICIPHKLIISVKN